MKRMALYVGAASLLFALTACGPGSPGEAAMPERRTAPATARQKGGEEMKIKITAGGRTLYARLEDNAAARAWAETLPVTLPMENLYDREMCYHYGAGTLPDGALRSDGYDVGDLIYWPPMGSMVILYAQNGERFPRQHIGHIEGDVSFFGAARSMDVTFERAQ